ncbi:uncharacterized protein V6R79_021763 [Siganus canaliculatus]
MAETVRLDLQPERVDHVPSVHVQPFVEVERNEADEDTTADSTLRNPAAANLNSESRSSFSLHAPLFSHDVSLSCVQRPKCSNQCRTLPAGLSVQKLRKSFLESSEIRPLETPEVDMELKLVQGRRCGQTPARRCISEEETADSAQLFLTDRFNSLGWLRER